MERVASKVLTEECLDKISRKISERIKQRVGDDKAIPVKQGIALRKTTNEIIMLITCMARGQDADNNFVRSQKKRVSAYLAIINIDEIQNKNDPLLYKAARVHQICYDRIPESRSCFGYISTTELPFEPHSICLNLIEKSFVIYGDDGILVGNLPGMLQNLKHEDDQLENHLLEPAKDAKIDSELVQPDFLSDFTILQAEFSHTNTQYLLVLTAAQSARQKEFRFQVVNLTEPGMPCELEMNLNKMMPDTHRYGQFNRNLNFVSFAQSAPHASDYFTLDIFSVHLLTENGHLYSICPLLTQKMVLREEHFSQILLQVNDMIEDQEEGSEILNKLRLTLIQGKQRIENRAGFCMVKMSPEEQQALQPRLNGPLKINNDQLGTSKRTCLLQSSSWPLSFLCVGIQSVELLVSFETPQFMFKQGNAEKPRQNFLCVTDSLQLPQNLQGESINLMRDPLNEFVFTLHSHSKQASSFIELDLKNVERLGKDWEDEKDLDFSKGIEAVYPQNSKGPVNTQHARFGDFYLGFNPDKLEIKLGSKKTIYQDKAEAFVKQMQEMEKSGASVSNELIKNFQSGEVDWQPKTEWQKNIKLDRAQEGDLLVDQFKDFLEGFIQHYVSHFESVEQPFNQRLVYLGEIKEKLVERAQSLNKAQVQIDLEKQKVKEQLKSVEDNNKEIQKRVASIQNKLHQINNPFPDDFILQSFIRETSDKLSKRKAGINSCLHRSQQALDFEKRIESTIKSVTSGVDPSTLNKLDDFVHEFKPKIDHLKKQVEDLQLK